MRIVLLFIRITLQFIVSILASWRENFVKKEGLPIAPLFKLDVAIFRRSKSISMHRNIQILLLLLAFSGWSYGQSTQDFGTGTGSFGGSGATSTSYLPNPGTGTNYVRISSGQGGGLTLQNPSPLGTTSSSLRATAATGTSVVKVTPILNNTAGKVAYARFKVMFGNSTGGNTATSGIWQMFLGNGAGYSDANPFTSNQVNVGLQFTYGASGAITMNYRNNANWSTTSLTSNPLFQSVYYDFEIFSNNKSSGTENYTYNGVSSSVAVGRFDLYVNGRILGNDLNDGELAGNSDIRSIMFTGISSTGNVANIFIDDVTIQNTLPTTISRLTNPAAFDLSSGNYSFTSWASTNSVGTSPSNMIFHWSAVNSQNPTFAQSVATQDYVWGYNYTMNDSRINGLDANGIEFRQENPGHSSASSGNLGEAVVSVNATGRQDVQVSWVAALNSNASMDYLLRGQYRIGNTGAFTNLPGTAANIEFNSTGATAGTPVSYGPITLPAACNNQSEVQIRWIYYFALSGTGSGDGIRLDDISISSSCLAPVATAGSALTAICQGGTSAALGGSVSLPATGGTWSTPAGGTFSPNATTLNATWTPPAGYSGTATLTLTTSGGSCGTATSSKTIVVNPTNTAGVASSTPTLCINTALTDITHATTGATGIGTATGLPAGVSATWASGVITISGTPTVAGNFSYTVPLTGGCGSVNATGTITVLNGTIDYANLQFPGSQTTCIGNNLTAFGRIYEAGVTEAAGANAIVEAQVGYNASNTNPNTWAAGNWINATYNVQSGNDDEYAGSFGSALAAGTYYYSFRYRMNGCAWQYGGFSGSGGGFYNGTTNVNGVLTVSPNNTVAAASSTPTLCINTALTNITHATTGATGIGSATGLPAGVAASWNSNTVTIYGTPSAAGTFLYSIPLTGGCGAVNATGTITVTPINTISLTSAVGTNAQLKCINSAITNITYSTTGAAGATFSGFPAGVSGAWASNVVTISGTPTAYGVYNYTVTLTGGCGSVTANGSINVNGLDYGNLQSPGSQTICVGNSFPVYGQVYEPGITEAGGANVNIVAQIGYNTSNTDPSTWPAGNWTNASYNVQSGNNDEYVANFGAALAVGTYYYTFRYSINGCSYQYAGAFSGFWNGTSNVNGVLTISPNNTVGVASSTPTVCINTALTNITHTTTGATGILNAGTQGANGLPAGVAASWNSNTVTIYGTPSASGTFNYSIPLTGGCGAVNATGTITVTPTVTINAFSPATSTRCQGAGTVTTTTTALNSTGITYSLDATTAAFAGNSINSSTGAVTYAAGWSGTTTITASAAGCNGPVTRTHVVTVTPTVTINAFSPATSTRCQGAGTVTTTTTALNSTGITYSLDATTAAFAGNSINSSTGAVTYAAGWSGTTTITASAAGCNGPVTRTHVVTVTPSNTISLTSAAGTNAQTVCRNTAITNITYNTTGATGISNNGVSGANGLPAGVSATWTANVVTISGTPTASGTFNYTVTLTGGCGAVNATGSIIVNAPSVGGTIAGSTSKCANNSSTLLTLSGYTGSIVKWQSSTSSTFASNVNDIVNTAATYTTPANLIFTTYYRAVVASGVCASVNSASATITITTAGSGTFAYANYGFCTSTTGAQAVAASNFLGVPGTYSSTAGLIINSTSGAITPNTSTAGAYVVTYTIPPSGGCPAYATTTNVTIDRAGSGTISYSPSTICTGTAGTVSPTITGAGGSGASTWFTAAPGTINMDANGVITPSTSAAGAYTITYSRSSTGLCPTYSTTTSVTINTSPTITSSTPGSRCGDGSVVLGASSSSGTVNWFDALTGGTNLGSGITYNTVSISANTTYYADAVSVNGCAAGARTAVLATVNAIPTVTGTTTDSNCGPGVLTLGATASAGTINWFAASTGGTSLGSGNTYNTPSISTTTNYFAEAVANGCSSPRSAVAATIVAIPTVASTAPNSNCGPGTVTLGATSTGTLNWYNVSTGGSSLATGPSFTTPSITANTTYYVDATANGCTSSPRTAVIASIATSPSISSFVNGDRCDAGTVGLSASPSAGATIYWFTAAIGGTAIATGNTYTTPSLSATTTYYIEARIGSCIQPSRTAITATINANPVAVITADYCSVPGNVVLSTNLGMAEYTWSTGGSTQSINVDQAGNYTVVIKTSEGCASSATFSVATELVTNGTFNAGNTGFTTAYNYVTDISGFTVQNEMYPEGTYAVVPNANLVHNAFNGQDRNGGSGNILVINGSPTLLSVWNQNSIAVIPNTTYYFSAWAMSVVNGNNAILQFSINGSQVGTIAYLPNGYTNAAGPYTWVRFYGQWESGPLTSANLSIVNLNTVAGGNDFALDDISFGTMSPIALSANPILNGNSVCQNDPLILNAGAIGGASPFTYSWTGPNGFTSTSENPVVTASASSTQNGSYTVVVTDGFGCTKTNSISVTVSAIPSNVTVSAAAAAVCSGGSTNINLSTSEIGVYYQLRNNANNASVGALVQGTGSAISLPTGVISATTTFNVLATRFPANCDVQMSITPTVTLSVTPEINITNQAACSGTVDLTAASVTAGSTGGGALTYWTTIAATTAVPNPAAVSSGTYFIRSTNGSCSDIEPVVVSVAPTTAAFTYGSPSYCTTGLDPIPTVTGTAGVFSSSSGLVFVNTNTGEIDLSASTPGTYNVVNTVTPGGVCTPLTATRSVIVTGAPLAGFNYISNDLCQSINPDTSISLNVSPIFDAGASGGTFSTSAGLSLNASTGVINVSTSTPGNYAVVNTRAATGGCPVFRDTTFLDVNPYTFTGSVSSSSSDEVICLNEDIDLYSNATSYATVLLREKFNGSINNWVTTNTSSGGTPASAAWTLRPEGYNYNSLTFSSNDDSQFYISNSRLQGSGGTTNTTLKSPVMSTVGFSTLSLDFFTYYRDNDATDAAKVQVSTNNTTWTDLVTYTTNQGSSSGFENKVFNLNAYIGLPTVYIRFVYTGANSRYWAIDNVSVTGNSINYGYAWATSPVGFTSALQNPTDVVPTVNSFYTVTATNGFGCSNSTSPVPVTVNPLPADNAGLDQNICGSGSVTLGNATTAGNTYVWTPAATLSSATIAQPSASPVANTTYTLTETITATGCSISNDVAVSVTPLPFITATTPGGRCGTGTVVLSATSSTGTMKWYANPTGGLPLGTANSFTTPSISANTTYYVEATSASCVASARVAVVATINAAPTISSQATAAASYSQNATATALSVSATAGSGTITGYQWFSNISNSNSGGTSIPSATTNTYTPSTAVVGILYYYCVVTNSNGCTFNSAVSGAITILVTPAITSITGSLPVVSGQAASTGYRGQRVTINGTNFESNSTVSFNGVPAISVTFVNANQLTAVVNNVGVNSSGNAVVTNPSNGAFTSAAFTYIGYLTSGSSTDWSANATWLGNLTPAINSNATIAHANTCNSAVTNAMNLFTVNAGASLTFGSPSSALTTVDVVNNGSMIWTNSGTLTIGNTLTLAPTAVFTAGAGNVVYNKAGDQQLFSGQAIVTFNNVSLAGSGNKSLALNTDIVVRNLIINAGNTFNLSTSDSEVLLRGDLTVDGNLAVGTSNFQFVGTVDQQVSVIAAGGTAVFSSMKVNKTAGLLLMNDNIQVQDSLIMVQGNINTQGYILEVGASITQRGTLSYTAGYVNGKMRRWYAAATNPSTASGIFPIGEFSNNLWESRRAQLNYTIAPSNGGHLTVEFIPIPMIPDSLGTQDFIPSANTGGAGFVVSNFSNDGYWKIDNLTNTLIDGEYNISLTGEGFYLPGGLNEMTVVKRVALGDWFCPGTHLAPTGNPAIPTLRRSGVSGFSNFGYAGGPNNALPITLVNFGGTCDGEKIQLNWSTESESNNKEYQIESSYDAYNWQIAEIVPGANNSNTLINYSGELRLESSNGIYIRLRQVDFNGNSKAFDPIFLKCGEVKLGNSIQMYPNPTLDISRIEIQSEFQTAVQLYIFSSSGQIVLNKSMQLNKGKNLVDFDMSGLAPGAYFVKLSNNNHIKFAGDKLLIKQ